MGAGSDLRVSVRLVCQLMRPFGAASGRFDWFGKETPGRRRGRGHHVCGSGEDKLNCETAQHASMGEQGSVRVSGGGSGSGR